MGELGAPEGGVSAMPSERRSPQEDALNEPEDIKEEA
jgi:hypothetical protein